MDNDFEITSIEGKLLYDFIYNIRGTRVMLDFDLAKIYGYTTKAFNRQVKNNIEKSVCFYGTRNLYVNDSP